MLNSILYNNDTNIINTPLQSNCRQCDHWLVVACVTTDRCDTRRQWLTASIIRLPHHDHSALSISICHGHLAVPSRLSGRSEARRSTWTVAVLSSSPSNELPSSSNSATDITRCSINFPPPVS